MGGERRVTGNVHGREMAANGAVCFATKERTRLFYRNCIVFFDNYLPLVVALPSSGNDALVQILNTCPLPALCKCDAHKKEFMNIVCFLLGNFPVPEFYMPTFRNTLSVPSS